MRIHVFGYKLYSDTNCIWILIVFIDSVIQILFRDINVVGYKLYSLLQIVSVDSIYSLYKLYAVLVIIIVFINTYTYFTYIWSIFIQHIYIYI